MAIRSTGADDRKTASASDLIRERARVAAAEAAERTGRVERGIGDAASVEISTAARNRAGLGSAVAQAAIATFKVPPAAAPRASPK